MIRRWTSALFCAALLSLAFASVMASGGVLHVQRQARGHHRVPARSQRRGSLPIVGFEETHGEVAAIQVHRQPGKHTTPAPDLVHTEIALFGLSACAVEPSVVQTALVYCAATFRTTGRGPPPLAA
jgi:hypothetical protein